MPPTIAASRPMIGLPGGGSDECRRERAEEQLTFDRDVHDTDPLGDHTAQGSEDERHAERERSHQQARNGERLVCGGPGEEAEQEQHANTTTSHSGVRAARETQRRASRRRTSRRGARSCHGGRRT
jgi:hypothetical protein